MKVDLRAYRTYQALILGGLGVFLLAKIGDGRILLYINQRFVVLVLAAALGLLLLGQAALSARPRDPNGGPSLEEPGAGEQTRTEERSAWGLWLLALPLLVGMLVPQRPLGASAATLRGFSTSVLAGGSTSASALEIPSPQRNVLDWLRAFEAVGDPSRFAGEVGDLVGFVYRDPRLGAGRFIAARFSVTCCVADATALGVEVSWPGVAGLAEGAWVRVRGKMSVQEKDGHPQPLLLADTVEPAPAPEQPYLFP